MIDTHVHLWNIETLRYPWLDEFAPLRHSFLATQYRQEVSASVGPLSEVQGIVVVQADAHIDDSFREVEWISEDARAVPVRGIVAYAPLERGKDVGAWIERLRQYPRVCGVRRSIQNEAVENIDVPGMRDGLIEAARAGLAIDMCLRSSQLPAVTSLLAAVFDEVPEARIVLDHLAKPDYTAEGIAAWERDITPLAAFPGVYCKVSGALTQPGATNNYPGVRESIGRVIELFGTSRVMAGSDWPVVNLAGGVTDWNQILEEETRDMSCADRDRFYRGTAIHFYGLSDGVSSAPPSAHAGVTV